MHSMFWNNRAGKEKEREREREEKICSLNGENDCPFYLTPCPRDRNKKASTHSNPMLLLLSYILIHLAGLLVAFDATTENYTVPVSGKCILTCYVAEVRSFKVSRSYIDMMN